MSRKASGKLREFHAACEAAHHRAFWAQHLRSIHRASLARLVAPFSPGVRKIQGQWVRDCPMNRVYPGRADYLRGTEDAYLLITFRRVTFDVHAARELALRMIRMSNEQAVFEDWCRDRGRGPEAVGLRVRCLDECLECICDTNPETTDGPDAGCPHHGWGRRTRAGVRRRGLCECGGEYPGDGTIILTQWPGQLAAIYAKAGGQASAAMGRSISRRGQRLFNALEGQPSECQTCSTGATADYSGDPCPDCKGTGHNLTGYI